MKKATKVTLSVLAALVIGNYLTACGEKSKNTTGQSAAVVQYGEKWVTKSGVDQFGNEYAYSNLNGKYTELSIMKKGANAGRLLIEQKGFIDCGNSTTAKIKIDDKPVKTVTLDMHNGCKLASTSNKALQNEILSAKQIVIQLNAGGSYSGNIDTIEVAQ
jgi:hypothetical protein